MTRMLSQMILQSGLTPMATVTGTMETMMTMEMVGRIHRKKTAAAIL